jgi:hypothetical protein
LEWQGHALWVELIVRRRLRARVAREGAILVIAMVGEEIAYADGTHRPLSRRKQMV